MQKNFNPILVVSGEPKSIFLEIFFKALKKKIKSPLLLIVNKKILKKQMKSLKFNFQLNELQKKEILKDKFHKNKINFINVNLYKNTNQYIEKSFLIALEILKERPSCNLINGPVIKEKFLKGKYPGITEYLGAKLNIQKNVSMLIYNKKLSVSPITTHVPLKSVHKYLNKRKIENHIKILNNFFIKILKKKPKIAVTGLNPHCESNFKDSEEKKIIIPVINNLKKKNINLSGPFPADTIFLRQNYTKFDVIVGMYHDQVLAPIKSLFEFNAINITMGLPFLRISPDHGPNSKMYGKNKSDPNSLIEAIKFLNKKCN